MENQHSKKQCKKAILAINDALEVLSGKWKIHIVAVLCYHHTRRFSEILNDVDGISNKMLSKELKDLEQHLIITRTVKATQPVTVEYSLTKYGEKLQSIILKLAEWGMEHRKVIMGIKCEDTPT